MSLMTALNFVYAFTHSLLTPYKYAVITCYLAELSITDSQKTAKKFLV